MLEIQKFARNPFYVDAVRITEDNMADVSLWCKGVIRSEPDPSGGRRSFIKVKVVRAINTEQTKAYIGDWVLYAGSGFKKYTDHAFNKSYTLVEDPSVDALGYAPAESTSTSSTLEEQQKFAEEQESKAVSFDELQNDSIQEEVDLATEHLTPDEAQQELPFETPPDEVSQVAFSAAPDTGDSIEEEVDEKGNAKIHSKKDTGWKTES